MLCVSHHGSLQILQSDMAAYNFQAFRSLMQNLSCIAENISSIVMAENSTIIIVIVLVTNVFLLELQIRYILTHAH